jgi:hypothetical protein
MHLESAPKRPIPSRLQFWCIILEFCNAAGLYPRYQPHVQSGNLLHRRGGLFSMAKCGDAPQMPREESGRVLREEHAHEKADDRRGACLCRNRRCRRRLRRHQHARRGLLFRRALTGLLKKAEAAGTDLAIIDTAPQIPLPPKHSGLYRWHDAPLRCRIIPLRKAYRDRPRPWPPLGSCPVDRPLSSIRCPV